MGKITEHVLKKIIRREVIKDFFYFFVLLLAVLCLLELIFPNIVLSYFNLNYLFLVCLGFAFLLIRK